MSVERRIVHNETLRDLRMPDSGYHRYEPDTLRFKNVYFDQCTFDQCVLQSVRTPTTRHVLRNLELQRCTATNCSIFTTELQNITIDTLFIAGGGRINHLTVEGAVFDRVTLRGTITGRLQLNPGPDSSKFLLSKNDPTYEESWKSFFRNYYEHVEWAIDISKAEFSTGPWLDCIPGHLVRRDPETQVLVRRESLKNFDLKEIRWKADAGIALQVFMERGLFNGLVVCASKRSRKFRDELEDIRLLRSIGLAEQD